MAMKKIWAAVLMAALMIVQQDAVAYSVNGRTIYNDSGAVVQLKGVNWFGFETTNYTVHGLWARNWKQMIQQMKDQGFNAVRLPFCPATLRGVATSSIDYSLNPDLAGKNSLAVLDAVITELNRQGMYILLDHHRADCNSIAELWYTSNYSEAQWLSDLRFVANRYKKAPRVIGIDLKNEPHGSATWGSRNNATDWNLAAGRAASQVLGVAPNWLIFVEGIGASSQCSSGQAAFWGENLAPLACTPSPVPANRLVLSPHTYGPDVFVQPYHKAKNFPSNMPAIWDGLWGFAIPNAPVVLGEFGGKYGEGDSRDRTWQNALVDYLIGKRINSGFYWSWNPNSSDTGGILRDDWTTVRSDKMALLRRLWTGTASGTTTGSSTGGTTGGTGTGGGTSGGTTSGGTTGGSTGGTTGGGSTTGGSTGGSAPTITVSEMRSSEWATGYCSNVTVRNVGTSTVVWDVTLTIEGRANQAWNVVWSQTGNKLKASGLDWNRTIEPNSTRDWGYCADR